MKGTSKIGDGLRIIETEHIDCESIILIDQRQDQRQWPYTLQDPRCSRGARPELEGGKSYSTEGDDRKLIGHENTTFLISLKQVI